MKLWLLEERTYQAIKSAIDSGYKSSTEKRGHLEARSVDDYEVFRRSGSKGIVTIEGILTERTDIYAEDLGYANTTYSQIVESILSADSDDQVKEIEMRINSPGGEFIDAYFDVLSAIQSTRKRVTAIAIGMAASAAYGILSQADYVLANNKATQLGSIGVAVSFFTHKDLVTITSDNAPKKRPNVKTEEGIKDIKETLNPMHDLLAESIAVGRGKTIEQVNSDFGQGATMLAESALKKGMIDAIKKPVFPRRNKSKKEFMKMDLATLKSEHPAIYAEAFEKGVKEGQKKEMDRVVAHLSLADGSGDFKTAHESIKKGEGLTSTVTAKHIAAGMNRDDLKKRQEDDKEAAKAVDNVKAQDGNMSDAEIVMAEVERQLRVSNES